ncbi:ORF6N domain-containing protein [bacterium]|nr:ORF6N domain-containing protein [bacterium]MBU1984344.1 ORF6N domain-containing protein [bacterium]
MHQIIPVERIENRIIVLRGERVMLDRDLAELYGVPTRTLNQAVTRNSDRFPPDFMFVLTEEEFENLRSQIVIANWGMVRFPPRAFTEQGVAMLSSVLRSKQAVQVNILIMRAFVKMREMLASHKELSRKLNDLEQKYDAQFRVVFDAIRQLMEPPPAAKKEFGFQMGKAKNGATRTKARKKS